MHSTLFHRSFLKGISLLLALLALDSSTDARRSGGGFGSRRSMSRPSHTRQTQISPRSHNPLSWSQKLGNQAQQRAPTVTSQQLKNWKSVRLPTGVPRRVLTYNTTASTQFPYQLSPGRYFPYPSSYYQRHGIGGDLLKYALIFTAVSSTAHALHGPDSSVKPAGSGTLWNYLTVGLLAAAAGWFLFRR